MKNASPLEKSYGAYVTDNPSATYRGYRKQAIYALWRILTDAEGSSRSYRPEGEEDLAVFDNSGRLVEAVQVKDFSTPLSLSDFKPGSVDGYFARMKRRQKEHPHCQHLIASFGPVGEELRHAICDSGKHQDAVAHKLNQKNPSISQMEGRKLLHALNGNIRFVNETTLVEDILASVKGTIAGAKEEVALDLLLFWIYDASEHLRSITQSTLLLQLQRIGNYLTALRDHTSEWMVAVRPLEAQALSMDEMEQLRIEYGRGVQARWKHILADADCLRPARLVELHDKLTRHSAVVIRGASGQGKSSLAFRYLYEYSAEGLRFQVRNVEGRAHAARIANALRGHVEQLRLSAIVLLDLAPTDSGWAELLRELIDIGLKVIVTVREEDYRRAGTFAPDIDVTELVLDSITREEAQAIYDMLSTDGHPASSLDFEDAWTRFSSADASPLLEFTHLVSEGQSLAAKVAGQVTRLQREAGSGIGSCGLTPKHLNLLALAVVANAAECRVSFKDLCVTVGVDPLTRPLQVLEDEYLVRQTHSGSHTTISGLHSLRSQAVETALLRDCPEMWGDLAIQCIPLIVDEDIERFLLHAFSRRQEHSFRIEAALWDVPLRTWTHAGGIGRALIWEGVNRYEQENHDTIAATMATHSSGWWMFCDSYVGMDSTHAENFWTTCERIFKNEVPKIHLTEKDHVFVPFTTWAYRILPPPLPPITATDWVLAGDLAFWLGNRRIESTLTSSLQQLLPEPLPQDISLRDFARFISGRHALGDAAFAEWHGRTATGLVQQFLRETKSVHVADDGEEVKVFFPVALADASSGMEDAQGLNAQAMMRVRLLRELYPHRDKYGSQGVGIEVLEAFVPYDETQKCIPAGNIPHERAVLLNAMFMNLADYRLRRANSWRDYANIAFEFRRSVCDCFHDLQRAWCRYLKEAAIDPKLLKLLPAASFDKIQKLSNLPMYPRTAVDEWGFFSEAKGKGSVDNQGSEIWNNLRRFSLWKKMWQEYENGVGQVAHLTLEETLKHIILKNKMPVGESAEEGPKGVLVYNLGSAWEALSSMQVEFRRWFSRYISPQSLQQLEHHEITTFRHLWAVAYNFIYEPLQHITGGAAALERTMAHKRREFLRHLREEVGSIMAVSGTARVMEDSYIIDGKTSLVIVCDHNFVDTIEPLRPKVVLAIWRAAQAPGWRNQEWQPLIIEWPHIFVTHTLQGKALFAGGASLTSLVFFATEADFEVQGHHLFQFPIGNSEYALLGISIWEAPLLPAVLNLQGAFLTFVFTLSRFYGLMKVALEYNLTDENLQQHLDTFSQEVSMLRRNSLQAFEDVLALLRILPDAEEPTVKEIIPRMEQLCNRCLIVDLEANTTPTITCEVFAEWAMHIEEDMHETNSLFTSLLKRAVEGGKNTRG